MFAGCCGLCLLLVQNGRHMGLFAYTTDALLITFVDTIQGILLAIPIPLEEQFTSRLVVSPADNRYTCSLQPLFRFGGRAT